MERKLFCFFFLFVILQLVGCETASTVLSPTETAASIEQSPAPTRIPTTTPFPTVTPNIQVETVKQVLLQYGNFGGNTRVSLSDAFLGRDLPSLVIYTDGQLVYQQDHILYSSDLSPAELCSLLAKIRQSGFFEAKEYTSQPPALTATGTAQTMIIQINGNPDRLVFFDRSALTYLSAPILDVLTQLQTYKAGKPVYYEGERLLLWIEPVTTDKLPARQTILDWPDSLPTIGKLWSDHTSNQAVLSGQVANQVAVYFSHRLQEFYVRSQSEIYRLIARPLLPHETPALFSIIPERSVSFNLPLVCTAPAVYLASATPTLTLPPPAASATPTLNSEWSDLTGRGRILFTSDRSGNQQLYMINSDGTWLERLTNNLYNDLSPAWSPDGSRIVFVSNRDGNNELYLMNADGSDQQRLTHTFDDEDAPDWSPDGKHLVFTRRCNMLENCTSQQDIYTMDLDGKNLRQLTDVNIDEFLPAWSPNGSRIAYVLGNQKGSSIYTVTASGTDRQVFGDKEMNASMPAWSPDGRHMAYVLWDPKTYQSDLYVAALDGSAARRLTFSDGSVSQPSWSPDARYLVYSLRQMGTSNETLWLVAADGSSVPLALTSGSQNDTRPAWGH